MAGLIIAMVINGAITIATLASSTVVKTGIDPIRERADTTLMSITAVINATTSTDSRAMIGSIVDAMANIIAAVRTVRPA